MDEVRFYTEHVFNPCGGDPAKDDIAVVIPHWICGRICEMVHDHIFERGGAFRERGSAFRAFINAGKAWVIGYHQCVAVAAGPPGKEGRAELERLTWEAVKKGALVVTTLT